MYKLRALVDVHSNGVSSDPATRYFGLPAVVRLRGVFLQSSTAKCLWQRQIGSLVSKGGKCESIIRKDVEKEKDHSCTNGLRTTLRTFRMSCLFFAAHATAFSLPRRHVIFKSKVRGRPSTPSLAVISTHPYGPITMPSGYPISTS